MPTAAVIPDGDYKEPPGAESDDDNNKPPEAESDVDSKEPLQAESDNDRREPTSGRIREEPADFLQVFIEHSGIELLTNESDPSRRLQIDLLLKYAVEENQRKNYQLSKYDIAMKRYDDTIRMTNEIIERNNKIIEEKNTLLRQKDIELTEKDTLLRQKDIKLEEKDTTIAQQRDEIQLLLREALHFRRDIEELKIRKNDLRTELSVKTGRLNNYENMGKMDHVIQILRLLAHRTNSQRFRI